MNRSDSSSGEVKELFESWVAEGSYPALADHEYDEILGQAGLLKAGQRLRVLDVGCGVGVVARRLKAQGHEVVGLDLSESAIEQAKKLGRIDSGVVGDIRRSGIPDGSFDVVIFFGVLLYLFDLSEVLAEGARILRPGGQLLVVDHHRLNPYVRLHFSRPDWVDRLLEGRSNVKRRPLGPELLRGASPRSLAWQEPAYFSGYTSHPNRLINAAHSMARGAFAVLRRVTQAPWTANILVMCATKAGER